MNLEEFKAEAKPGDRWVAAHVPSPLGDLQVPFLVVEYQRRRYVIVSYAIAGTVDDWQGWPGATFTKESE